MRVDALVARALGATLALSLAALPLAAGKIELVVLDGPGEGFNATTSVAPVTGNEATTLGGQRSNVFKAAAGYWSSRLLSNVSVRVEGDWKALTCTATSATLASAGPVFVYRDFEGAPLARTWYVGALADMLAGSDLDPFEVDAFVLINSSLGSGAGCLAGSKWDYSVGGGLPDPLRISLYDTLVHELGHALGFLTFVDLGSGQKFLGFDDPFMLNLADLSVSKGWGEMTDAERRTSATANLYWVGSHGDPASRFLASGADAATGFIDMYSPSGLEIGSSVVHWDTSLAASLDELMEPTATDSSETLVTLQAFQDLGWSVDFQAISMVPDVNGNKIPDVAIHHSEFIKGSVRVTVVDGLTSETLASPFKATKFAPQDLATIKSFGGTAASDLVTLSLRSGDGLIQSSVIDSGSGQELGTIKLDGRFVLPLGVEIAPSFGGTSAPEAVFLAMHKANRAARIFVHDTQSGALLTQVSFAPGLVPLDHAVVNSFGGTDAAEIALLYRDGTSRRLSLLDARSGAQLALHTLPSGFEPVYLAAVPSFGGTSAQELAIVGHAGFGGTELKVLDASSGSTLNSQLVDGVMWPKGVAVLADYASSAAVEIAVWGRRSSSLADRVYVFDGAGGLLSSLTLSTKQEVRDVAVLPDFSSGPADELAILVFGREGGKLQVFVHDAGTGQRISTLLTPALRTVAIDPLDGGGDGDAPGGLGGESRWTIPERDGHPVVE